MASSRRGLLARWGAAVTVVVPVERRQADGLAASAADYGCTVLTAASGLDTGTLAALLSRADLIIDALLGTGRRRPLEGPVTSALSAARQAEGACPRGRPSHRRGRGHRRSRPEDPSRRDDRGPGRAQTRYVLARRTPGLRAADVGRHRTAGRRGQRRPARRLRAGPGRAARQAARRPQGHVWPCRRHRRFAELHRSPRVSRARRGAGRRRTGDTGHARPHRREGGGDDARGDASPAARARPPGGRWNRRVADAPRGRAGR